MPTSIQEKPKHQPNNKFKANIAITSLCAPHAVRAVWLIVRLHCFCYNNVTLMIEFDKYNYVATHIDNTNTYATITSGNESNYSSIPRC